MCSSDLAAAGSRITSITLNGTAIDPNGEYTVAANSFLAAGGDNFATFKEGAGKRDTGKIDLQSMVTGSMRTRRPRRTSPSVRSV